MPAFSRFVRPYDRTEAGGEAVSNGTTWPAPTELERIAQVSYDAGERGILELLDAYLEQRRGQRRPLLDAAVRYAEIELELASGWEIR